LFQSPKTGYSYPDVPGNELLYHLFQFQSPKTG